MAEVGILESILKIGGEYGFFVVFLIIAVYYVVKDKRRIEDKVLANLEKIDHLLTEYSNMQSLLKKIDTQAFEFKINEMCQKIDDLKKRVEELKLK